MSCLIMEKAYLKKLLRFINTETKVLVKLVDKSNTKKNVGDDESFRKRLFHLLNENPLFFDIFVDEVNTRISKSKKGRSLKSSSLKSRSLKSRSLKSRSLKSRSLKSRSLKSSSLKSSSLKSSRSKSSRSKSSRSKSSYLSGIARGNRRNRMARGSNGDDNDEKECVLDTDCKICWEDLSTPVEGVVRDHTKHAFGDNNCYHAFHTSCLQTYHRNHPNQCPYCNRLPSRPWVTVRGRVIEEFQLPHAETRQRGTNDMVFQTPRFNNREYINIFDGVITDQDIINLVQALIAHNGDAEQIPIENRELYNLMHDPTVNNWGFFRSFTDRYAAAQERIRAQAQPPILNPEMREIHRRYEQIARFRQRVDDGMEGAIVLLLLAAYLKGRYHEGIIDENAIPRCFLIGVLYFCISTVLRNRIN